MSGLEQLKSALIKADAAGNTDDAKVLADAIRSYSNDSNSNNATTDTVVSAENLKEIGAAPELNEMSLSALKSSFGLLTTGDDNKLRAMLKKNLPDATFRESEADGTIIDLPSGSYALNKAGLSGQDIVKGLFDFSAFTPAGRLAGAGKGLLGKALAVGAGSAATEAGLQGLSEGDIDAGSVATAGALGVGGQVLGDAIGVGARALKGKMSEGAKQTIEAGKQADVNVLTSDVIPPKGIVGGLLRQAGERIPVTGTSGIRAAQQESREQAVKEFAGGFEPVVDVDIFNSLRSQANKVKKAAGNRLGALKDRMDAAGDIDISETLATIDDTVAKLGAKGTIKDTATIDALNSVKETLLEAPQSFSMLRSNRTAIRELVDATDAAGRSQLPSLTKSMMNGIKKAVTKDLDSFVLKNEGSQSLAKYKKADLIYGEEARKLTQTRLKNVLDKGDMTPENVQLLLRSKKPSEIKMLYNSLDTQGKNSARSSLVARAVDAATVDDVINPTRFINELKKTRESTGVFFRGDDAKRLRGLTKLINATKRAQEAPVITPTGQALQIAASVGAGSQLGLLPALGAALTGGGAARIYESKPMRNLLLKLANTPAGSTAIDAAIIKAMPSINATMQSTRREGEQ